MYKLEISADFGRGVSRQKTEGDIQDPLQDKQSSDNQT